MKPFTDDEIERLREWKEVHPYSEIDMDMHVEAVTKKLRDEIERLQKAKRRALAIADERSKENVALRAALEQIESWSRAYPLEAFPKPDLERAAHVLQAAGMTLDAISADAMRHVVEGVGKIARDALSMGKSDKAQHDR